MALESLPPEIRARIFDFLNHDSLTRLMRANKALHQHVEPLIWTKIELHRPGYHEYYQYEEEFDFAVNRDFHSNRLYHALNLDSYYLEDEYDRQDDAYCESAFWFFKTFTEAMSSADPWTRAHYKTLAQKVRFLCLTVELNRDELRIDNCWSVLALFQNLEHLELIVKWPYDFHIWDAATDAFQSEDHLPLTKLHTLHLRGYLPKKLVIYLCQRASTIEDLELALLDRPIGGINRYCRENPPPGPDEPSPDDDASSSSSIDISSSASDESFDHEQIAPRALAALLDTDLLNSFTSLTHLSLIRPAESSKGDQHHHEPDVYVSPVSEQQILEEWRRLMAACRSSLEHLVIDQRPMAEEIEADSTGDAEDLILYPYGPGYRNFVERVLPILLGDEAAEFPKLKSIRLYGFDVPSDIEEGYLKRRPSRMTPLYRIGETLVGKVEARFGALGVNVECGLGRRMIYEDEDGTVRSIGADGFGGRMIEANEAFRA